LFCFVLFLCCYCFVVGLLTVIAMEYDSYVYEVQVHYGKNLPKMDVRTMIDPYVMIKFPGGNVAKTRVFDNNANPVWDSPADLLVGEAPKDWTLQVELWDKDKATSDDHVCDIKLPRSELPVTRREYPVDKKGGVLCISVSFFCAPSCAKERLHDPVTYVKASDGQDWYAPVPGAEFCSVGLHYNEIGNPLMYVVQTDPASILNAFARFVAVEDAAATPVENTLSTHFLVGGASLVSVSDVSRIDVLRRIGGAKGLRVFGEVQVQAPGSVPLNKLAVKVVRKRTLIDTFKLSDIAKDAAWSRTTSKYSDAKACVKDCVLDDKNELVYFDKDPRFTVSTTCSFTTATVTAYLKAGNPGIYIDMIHSSANERNVVEYAEPVSLADGKVNVMSKITIAEPPNVMRFDQVFIMVYKEEDVIVVPVLSVLPLA